MKFFSVILAVISIESIGNYVGQATADNIIVTVESIFNVGSRVLTTYHTPRGNTVSFLKDVNKGGLDYFMELKMDNRVIEKGYKPRDFCEDTPEAQILRGALLPEGKTSCPVKKGDYKIPNSYDVDISDTAWAQMKCGMYTGKANIKEARNAKVFFEMKFNFYLDANHNKCKK